MKMKFEKKDVIFPILTAAIFVSDQLLKNKAKKELAPGGSREFGLPSFGKAKKEGEAGRKAGSLFLLRNSHNEGAAMNLFEKHPSFVRGLAVGYTITLSVLYVLTLGLSGSTLLKTGLSFLLGGAYSNTFDRMKDHYVTDYLSLNFGPKFLRKICCNLADFAISIGAFLSVMSAS